MKILAFDSTAKAASVAVCEDEKCLALYTIDNGLTQSELLMPMAENILKCLHLSFDDIELACASMGPGSFTGVRIGAALVKGIAFGRDIPCVSVSTIEALAKNAMPLKGIIVPVMDARRGQVYTAIFKSDGKNAIRMTKDDAISITSLAEMLKEYEGEAIYLVGDGYAVASRGLKAADTTLCETPPLLINENAYSIALVALEKFRCGEFVKDTEIAPIYLRMPQAERERLERLGENK